MKKRVLAIVLSVMLTAGLIGCGKTPEGDTGAQAEAALETAEATEATTDGVADEKKDEETSAAEEKQEETTEEATGDTADGVSVEAYYGDVLATVYLMLDEHPDEMYEKYYNELIGVWEYAVYSDDALNAVGYTFDDLNQDGNQELIIANIDITPGSDSPESEILAVYGKGQDGKPASVLTGYSRNMYYLLPDKTFYNFGSSGAAYSEVGIFRINDTMTGLTCIDQYFTYPEDDDYDKIHVYHNKTGSLQPEDSELTTYNESEIWNLYKGPAYEFQQIDLKPFSMLALEAPESTATDGAAGVIVSYAKEADLEKYDSYTADESDYAVYLLIKASGDVKNLQFLAIENLNVSATGQLIGDGKEVFRKNSLSDGEGILVLMTFMGDMPSYAISYEVGGKTYHYAIAQSGKDGSVELEELFL